MPFDYRVNLGEIVRKYLSDAKLLGLMPDSIAQQYDRDPDRFVEKTVSALWAAQEARINGEGDETIKPIEVSLETLQSIALILSVGQEPVTEKKKSQDGALLFVSRATKYLKDERFSDAKSFFKRALEIDKSIKSAWLGLAEAHERLGEKDQAEAARQQASLLT